MKTNILLTVIALAGALHAWHYYITLGLTGWAF